MIYSVVDIESTGGAFNEEGIIDIAILRYDGYELIDQFHSLVDPERPIQSFVSKLTGIKPAMVKGAPKFYQLAKRIIELTEGAIFVAHNTQFDYKILQLEFDRLGYNFERKTLCTVELSQKLLPGLKSYKLGQLTKELGIPLSDRHRALGDAEATSMLLKVLLSKEGSDQEINDLTYSEIESDLKPSHIQIVRKLPESTGIYWLYNAKSELLECGHAKNIKNHVSNLLSSLSIHKNSIYKSVKKVETERCESELYNAIKVLQIQLTAKPRRRFNLKMDSSFTAKFPNKSNLLIDKGRTIGECAVFLIENQQVKAMGFYDLNYQLTSKGVLEKRLSPVQPHKLNELILSHYMSFKNYEILSVE
jgi:DNA polymerase-3 subunit epsilon